MYQIGSQQWHAHNEQIRQTQALQNYQNQQLSRQRTERAADQYRQNFQREHQARQEEATRRAGINAFPAINYEKIHNDAQEKAENEMKIYLCLACPIITLIGSAVSFATSSAYSDSNERPFRTFLEVSGMLFGGIGVGVELIGAAFKIDDYIKEQRAERRRTNCETI